MQSASVQKDWLEIHSVIAVSIALIGSFKNLLFKLIFDLQFQKAMSVNRIRADQTVAVEL